MEKVKIGNYVKQIRGVSYKPNDLHNDLNSDSVILLRANNINEGKINFDDIVYVDKSKVKKEQYLKKGDILVCASSGSKELVGKAAFINKDYAVTFGAFCKLIRPKDCIAGYLGHYFNSQMYKEKISSLALGANINNIRNEHIDELLIYLPNKAEQQNISILLDEVSDLTDKRKKQLEKLDRLVKSRFVEMFGDTILNPFGWEKDSLGTVCDVRDGTHDSPKYYETGYPLVTSKNVTGGRIDLTGCSLICEVDFNKINERSKVDIGDIIMPMIGTVGKPVIVKIEPNFAIKNVALIKFKNNSKVLNVYVQTLLQSDYFDDAILSNVRGGTQKFISLGDIRKLEVIVPPLELQEQFAAFVEQVDKSKFEIKQSLEKLELLKKALMQKYFR